MNWANVAKTGLVAVSVVFVAAATFRAAQYFGNPDPIEIRSYVAPPEIASELRSALGPALSRGEPEHALGRVALLPNGRLLVTAPASVQAGVRRIIDEIIANPPVPTPTIRFEAWIVAATPGGTAPVPDNLAEVEPALSVIRNAKGLLTFSLIEKLSTSAQSGLGESKVRGAESQMEISATLRRGEDERQVVAAKVIIEVGNISGPIIPNAFTSDVELEAYTEMRPGELLVVGQSALARTPNPQDKDVQVYYILRAAL